MYIHKGNNPPQQNDIIYRYDIIKGKPIIIRAIEVKGGLVIEPQTQVWLKIKGNVTQDDIAPVEALSYEILYSNQKSINNEVAAYLALSTIIKLIKQNPSIEKNIIKTQAQNLTPYQILGVPETATKKEIEDAAQDLSRQIPAGSKLAQNAQNLLIKSIILKAKNKALANIRKQKKK